MAGAGVGVGVAAATGTEAAGEGLDDLSSSFARVELFLQPATNSGRIRISGRIRRSIPVTKGADYHVPKEVTSAVLGLAEVVPNRSPRRF